MALQLSNVISDDDLQLPRDPFSFLMELGELFTNTLQDNHFHISVQLPGVSYVENLYDS